MTALTQPTADSPTLAYRLVASFTPLAFAGARPDDTDDEKLRKALLMSGSLLILPVALVWAILYLAFDERPAALVTFAYAAVNFAAIVYLIRTGRQEPLSIVHWSCTLFLPFVLTILLGGLMPSSAIIIGALMAPLGALLYHERAAVSRLFLAYVGLVVLAGLITPFVTRQNNLPLWLVLTLFVLNIIIVSAQVFFQMQAFVRQRDDALRMLRLEQDKTDSLLCNILPRSIADILKNDTQTIAERFDAVSILFADVVGFTPLSAIVEPEEMVTLLNEIYTHFDNVVDRYGLEKIRTMGDGYMVASGVPLSRPDHAHALAAAALEMMSFLDTWASPYAGEFEFRMGMNSGPVLAGVIGRKKFSYDVWGDPVNVASRMESHGEPGKIQVSKDTYQLLKDDFLFEPRGPVAIKGKGEMETWFLVGRRTT